MEKIKGEGIVLDFSEIRRIPVVNGGGSVYWDSAFQSMLRTNQYGGEWARFFPCAEVIDGTDGGKKVRFSYIEHNNAKEAISLSRGMNEGSEDKQGIRRGELEAFFAAIEGIHKLEQTATEPDNKSFISTLRLPDPTQSPEKYRIYIGSDGKEHLAVLWGYERLAEHDCCDTHPLDEFKRRFQKFVLPDTVDKLKYIHKIILGVTALLIAILIIVLIAKAFSRKDKEPSTGETPIVNTTDGGNGQGGTIGLGTPTPVVDGNGAAVGSNANPANAQNATNGNDAASGNGAAGADNGNNVQSTQAGTPQSGTNASSSTGNSTKAEKNGIVATDGSESAKQQNTATENNSSVAKDQSKSELSAKKSDENSTKSTEKNSNVAKDQSKSESSAKKSDENSVKSTETNSNVSKDQSKNESSAEKKDENNAKNVNESTAKAQDKAQATDENATAKDEEKAVNAATVAPVKIAKSDNEAMLGSRNDVRLKISDMTLQKKKVQVTLELEAISAVKDSKITEITMDGKKPEKNSNGKAMFLLELNHRYRVQGRIEYDKNGQKYTNTIDDFLQLNLGATLDSAKQ